MARHSQRLRGQRSPHAMPRPFANGTVYCSADRHKEATQRQASLGARRGARYLCLQQRHPAEASCFRLAGQRAPQLLCASHVQTAQTVHHERRLRADNGTCRPVKGILLFGPRRPQERGEETVSPWLLPHDREPASCISHDSSSLDDNYSLMRLCALACHYGSLKRPLADHVCGQAVFSVALFRRLLRGRHVERV